MSKAQAKAGYPFSKILYEPEYMYASQAKSLYISICRKFEKLKPLIVLFS
jgi:hypothetical protein